jgi:uncharacterized membrane protein
MPLQTSVPIIRCALSALAVSMLLSASGCAYPVKPQETAGGSAASERQHSRWNCDSPSADGEDWQACRPASEAFSAKGQEPHWWLRIEGDGGQLMRPGLARPIEFELRTLGSEGADTVISAAAPEATLEIRLRDSLCRDAMSGMPHPQTVTIELPDRQLRGCGGEPMQLLSAQPWRLQEAVSGHAEATLRFEQGSQLRMEGPCHQHVGTFVLSGEGLELRLPPSSQSACPEPAAGEERRLLDALSATVRFDIDDEGALILIGPNGRVLRAQALPGT